MNATAWMRQTEAECLKAAVASAPTLSSNPWQSADESPEYAADQYRHFRGWAYASIRAIAQKLSAQPVHVAKLPTGPRKAKHMVDDLEPLDTHPLLDALANPNPIMTQWHLWYVTVVSLEVSGRAFWLVKERQGRKTLWPLPPHWVKPEHKGGYFSSYRVSPGAMSEGFHVPGERMVYFNYPDVTDPSGSYGPMQANSRAVYADDSIAEAMTAVFRNGLYPGLAFIVGDEDDEGNLSGDVRGHLTHDQRNEILTGLKRFYRGPAHQQEPLLLDALIRDVKQISTKPREMDFMKTGQEVKGRVTQGFGVNPIILGQIEGANRASSVEARKHFIDFTINPKIEMLSQILDCRLRPHFEPSEGAQTLKVWMEPCTVDDPESRLAEDKFLWSTGATDVAELRARRNMPPRPDLEGKQ